MRPRDEALGLELRGAVVADRPRLRGLVVRRALLAVEDEVGREVDEPSARAMRGSGNRAAAADDRSSSSGPDCTYAVWTTASGPWRMRARSHSVGVADVELQRLSVRRRRAELRRKHVVAALDRLAAELGAEIAGAAGDEELHRTIVTGPSFTSSTAIVAPKTPRSTGTPSAASSAQNCS